MLGSLAISLLVAFALIQTAVFGTTIYLHRTATHKAIELHPAVAWLFRFSLWVTTGISTRQWVAVHRKHHAFTDEEGDPHSPMLEGFWPVQLGNVFYYAREASNPEVVAKYAKDIKEDVWDRWFFNYGAVGPVAGTITLCFAIGLWPGLLAAGLHAFVYVFVLSSSINGLCHHVGYKNFQNTATNIRILGWLAGGEGLHNNHHAYPRSPKFSLKPSEIDPAWPVIKVLAMLGLARPYKTIEQSLS